MKTYLFSLGHPAHFHMFKHTMRALSNDGHKVVVIVRPKDVLEQLCINEGLPYMKVGDRSDKGGKLGKAAEVVRRFKAIARIVRKEKPCMLIGSDGVMAYLGKWFHIPSFEFFDDDYGMVVFPVLFRFGLPQCHRFGAMEEKKDGIRRLSEVGLPPSKSLYA